MWRDVELCTEQSRGFGMFEVGEWPDDSTSVAAMGLGLRIYEIAKP
jgi:hypothetical protein